MSQRSLFADDIDPWERDELDDLTTALVAFSVAPFGPYDYLIPPKFRQQVVPGVRVQVPLGRGNRPVMGYVVAIGQRQANAKRLKAIDRLIDEQPLCTPELLRLTEWMSTRYLCPLGQVLEGIIPSGVRSQAGTREMTFLQLAPVAKAAAASDFTSLKLPVKQLEIVRSLAKSPRPLTPPEVQEIADCTLGPIQALRKKGLVTAEVKRVQNLEIEEEISDREPPHMLHQDQQAALASICEALNAPRHEVLVLHGVTGSGKTEVYVRAIEEAVSFGRQAIVLVPEISLTPQTKQRFRARFDRVAVLHSHLSDSERHWHWQRIASGEIQVVVGARSAVFAPTPRLGLIVIDEEHEPSFKQDSTPRYHAREVAIERARALGIPLVLGSATPSLESYFAAQAGNAKWIEMPSRVAARPLPDVEILDLRAGESGRLAGPISRKLVRAIEQSLADKGQVILLLNRRGFSTNIQCPACGFVAKCEHCDVSLTHHRQRAVVVCHYCDYQVTAPMKCPDCKFDGIQYGGLGTEKLESEVKARFPQARVLRMDSDTMQRHGSHEDALSKFREGSIDILLGTQMIAKGLDFPNVTLVGVINADTALHFPDFRAAERTFQLVTQVAGRTGRGTRPGQVLVQTFSPEHPALLAAKRHDYAMFVAGELPMRRDFGFPPASNLIRLIVRGDSEKVTLESATAMTGSIVAREGLSVRGPVPCPLARLRGKFRFHTLIFGSDAVQVRDAVREASKNWPQTEDIQWQLDVDPMDLL